jgi:hypothetical protein
LRACQFSWSGKYVRPEKYKRIALKTHTGLLIDMKSNNIEDRIGPAAAPSVLLIFPRQKHTVIT